MARAAAGRRRSKETRSAKVTSRVVRECVGVALVGLALLLALGLWTFSPDDALFEAGNVENRAGVFGATTAAVLFGTLGLGAVVFVVALGYVGLRLLLARGVPPPTSRFWVGAVLLILAAATLPPLVAEAFPGRAAGVPAGWLGRSLASAEGRFVGAWGALLLNAVIVSIGALSWTGVSTGAGLGAIGVALGWVGGALAAVAIWLFESVSALVGRAQRPVGIGEQAAGEQNQIGPLGGNGKYEEYTKSIREAGGHLLSLINDLLEHSRIEAGKLDLHETDVDIGQVVDEVLRLEGTGGTD